MSSIPYSFHWVRKSLDEKKRRDSELNESIPKTSTTDSTQLKTTSFSWFNQLFKPQINNNNNNEQEYSHSINFDFEFLHTIL